MFLIDLLPTLITVTFITLVVAALIVARKYGDVAAYVTFAWVTPLAGLVWLKWGEDQLGFGYSSLNTYFVPTVIFVSFAGIVCLPAILYLHWHRLSAAKITGVGLCGLFHALPFLAYVMISLSVAMYGE